ncbi:AfsR/SARP family transcriptional regulator [Krasilnikovia sp. M28-CT-15]|uniref:AfsR/SARP family transcriptional regulator n=1 Tax=Krasilnikovia sp. M28-CT-15 TaxID=3373540 RepID=UPI003876D09D
MDLGGARQRIVLAVLALNADRVVPVDHLIDAVWGGNPPHTARSQIQISVSVLRRLFGEAGCPDAIITRSPGYTLRLDAAEVDSLHFARLIAEARRQAAAGAPAEAAATLRTALALWRGDALSNVPSEMVRRAATVLEDQRVSAIEERIHLDLALGAHQNVISELQALVTEHPLRERLYVFLMLALYRSGRQSDALKTARRAREVLTDEMGLDPGDELQRLERAILRRDPALGPVDESPPAPARTGTWPAVQTPALSGVVPRQLPASITDFIGREEQLAEIRQVLGPAADSARAGWSMPMVVISGTGGVGKSSLAIRAAHELSHEYPDGQLYADIASWGQEPDGSRILSRFLRALGVSGKAIPDGRDERGELYRSLLSGKRFLVVLDDTPPGAELLPLLPGSASCAVLITSRARLTALPGARHIDVDVFEPDESQRLLITMVGAERIAAGRESAVELANLCGGLPLALRIAGARLTARPHWPVDRMVHRLRDEANRLDELTHQGLELRSTIELTYRILDASVQRLFRLCAVMRAPDFPAWTAAALLDTSLFQAEDLLESLVEARLVDVVHYPGALPRYRLHDLIRVYAAEKLATTETDEERGAALNRVLSAWLGLAEEAHRRHYGGDFTILHGSAPRWTLPPAEAARQVGEPIEWWETERRALVVAVRQAADAGFDELCWDLALTTVGLFESRGYFDDWRECSTIAYELAVRTGNRIGMGAMQYSLGSLSVFQRRVAPALDHFTTALEILRAEGSEHGCALVLRNVAILEALRGDDHAMLAKFTESLALMRKVGDRIGEAHILHNLAQHRMKHGDHPGALDLLGQAHTICRETGCLRVEAQVMYRYAEVYLATNKLDPARQALHRVLRIVRASGDRMGEAYALFGWGRLRQQEGRLRAAELVLAHAVARASQLGEHLIEARCRCLLGEIALTADRPELALKHLRRARDLFRGLDVARYEEAGELAEQAAARMAARGLGARNGVAYLPPCVMRV